jgi:hypothetical protein
MRGLLGIKAFAITTLISFCGIKGSAAENQYYFFDGNTLDTNLWGDISGQDTGSLYYNVAKGRLNFFNPSPKTNQTDNATAIYFKPSLSLNADWIITLGLHNSSYCADWGSNKIQAVLFESGFLSGQNNDPEHIATQLGPDRSFYLNPQIWIHGAHNDHLPWPYGPTFYGGQDVSFKFVYTFANKKLKILYSSEDTDPNSNNYNFIEISNLTIVSNTSFNLALMFRQNASDSSIPANTIVSDGQIWVDNFSVTYPSNNSIANTYSLVLQESQNLINWTSISTNIISNTNPQAFFRLQIQKR